MEQEIDLTKTEWTTDPMSDKIWNKYKHQVYNEDNYVTIISKAEIRKDVFVLTVDYKGKEIECFWKYGAKDGQSGQTPGIGQNYKFRIKV